MRAIILAAAATLAFASSVHAVPDPNEHPRAGQKIEARAVPHCSTGKQLCGHACIAKSKVCHKTLDPQSGLPTGQRMHKPA